MAARDDTSTRVLHDVYVHRISGQQDTVRQWIEDGLDAETSVTHLSRRVKQAVLRTVGTARDPVRYLYANQRPVPRIAHASPARQTRSITCTRTLLSAFQQFRRHLDRTLPVLADGRIRPTHSPRGTADGLMNRSLCAQKPVTQSCVTGFELRKLVAGVGFEPT